MSESPDFTKQSQDMMEHSQKLMKDGIEQTKEAFEKTASSLESASKEYENVYATAQSATRKLSEKAVENFKTNSEAVVEYANALAGCSSPSEAVEVQSKFLTKQFELMSRQTKEFFELSNEATTNVVQSATDAVKKSPAS